MHCLPIPQFCLNFLLKMKIIHDESFSYYSTYKINSTAKSEMFVIVPLVTLLSNSIQLASIQPHDHG